MTYELRKKERLLTIEKLCNEGKIVIKEKLICNLCYEWGCGRRIILEYLKILEGCGRIKILGKDIHGKEVRSERKPKEVLGKTG